MFNPNQSDEEYRGRDEDIPDFANRIGSRVLYRAGVAVYRGSYRGRLAIRGSVLSHPGGHSTADNLRHVSVPPSGKRGAIRRHCLPVEVPIDGWGEKRAGYGGVDLECCLSALTIYIFRCRMETYVQRHLPGVFPIRLLFHSEFPPVHVLHILHTNGRHCNHIHPFRFDLIDSTPTFATDHCHGDDHETGETS